jgi:hypothetical protein
VTEVVDVASVEESIENDGAAGVGPSDASDDVTSASDRPEAATAETDQPDVADSSAEPDHPAPSDVWPGAAPVPDDGEPGRDDAGAASSDDDTPPA